MNLNLRYDRQQGLHKADANRALRELNFQVSGRISVVMCTFSVFGLSYGRSKSEPPTSNFGISRSRYQVLTLFRATKNSVVICTASLLYEMSYSFCSTLFVPRIQILWAFFRPNLNYHPDQLAAFSTWSMMTCSIHINRHSWLLTWMNQYVCENQYTNKFSFSPLETSTLFEETCLQFYYE